MSYRDDINATLDAHDSADAATAQALAAARAEIVVLQDLVHELEANQPTSWISPDNPVLGMYEADLYQQAKANNGVMDDGKYWTGKYPGAASSYWQPNNPAGDVPRQLERIKHGTIPVITLTVNATGYLTGIVNGDAAALAWLDKYIASLKTMSEADPNVPVLATLCHEYDVQIIKGKITGKDADPSGVLHGKALNVFFKRCRAAAPKVKLGIWFNSGSDLTAEKGALSTLVENPDWIGADFYSTQHHPATETLANVWARFKWIKDDSNYQRLGSPILIAPEFGASTTHGDDNVAAFYADPKGEMKKAGLSLAIMFNRDSGDSPYRLNNGDTPKAEAAFAKAL